VTAITNNRWSRAQPVAEQLLRVLSSDAKLSAVPQITKSEK
jgi:hypothetical protein